MEIRYIYISSPINAIKYVTTVNEIDLSYIATKDDELQIENSNYSTHGRYMEIKLINIFHENLIPYSKLKIKELNSVQNLFIATSGLIEFINMLKNMIIIA